MQKPGDPSMSGDQAVLHLREGRLLKGALTGFTPTAETVYLNLESEPAKAPI